MVYCLPDPCQGQVCTNRPHAICVSDFCGGCFARFYVSGNDVTDECVGKFLSYVQSFADMNRML